MSGFYEANSLRAAKSHANYLFEGDFRRRPNQNLSGATRVVSRGQLLQEAALQRQDREDRRRREVSSIKIQAIWRGYKTRKTWAAPLRLEFDELISSIGQSKTCDDNNALSHIIRVFLLFYHTKIDNIRLITINNLIIDRINQIICEKQINQTVWTYRITKLLKINLTRLSKQNISTKLLDINGHLKFIEQLTRDNVLDSSGQSIAWKALMEMDLFSILRNIIDSRQDICITSNDASFHEIILELIRRSINIHDIDQCHQESIGSLFTVFFCGPLNIKLEEFYLGRLLESKPTGLEPHILLRSFEQLINTTVQNLPTLTKASRSCDSETVLPYIRATWLSYTFVKLIDGQIERLSEIDKCKYLNILAKLISPIENLFNYNNFREKINEDIDNISDHNIPNDQLDETSQSTNSNDMIITTTITHNYSKDIADVIYKLVNLINCQSHVNSLRSVLFNSESNSQVHVAIIKICNFTLAHENLAIFNCPLLYTIAFNWDFLRKLWKSILTISTNSLFGHNTTIYKLIAKGDSNISQDSWDSILPRLKLFCSIYSYLLPTLDDQEFYTANSSENFDDDDAMIISNDKLHNQKQSFTSTTTTNKTISSGSRCSSTSNTFFVDKELIGISAILRDLCVGMIDIIYHENKYVSVNQSVDNHTLNGFNIRLCFKAIVRLVCQIHARDSRKQFCPTGHWICPAAMVPTNKAIELHQITSQYGRLLDQIDDPNNMDANGRIVDNNNHGTVNMNKTNLTNSNIPRDIKGTLILQEIPFVIPFAERVQMFHQLINQEKRMNTNDGYFFGIQGHAIALQVRRNYIYEDAFRKLSNYGSNQNLNMKSPLKVSLINAVGADEAGIDGGGVTKEFLSELLKAGFDPMRGFFKTTHDHQLYPNPSAKVLFTNLNEDDPNGFIIHYEFLGKMLGKALLEKVMVELRFASFFLAKILARNNESDVDWHNLASLDPIVYKNLVYLKNYTGDVADLNLDFTITNNELDEKETVELKEGGSSKPVTRSNRVEYIHLVADYRLNKQIRAHCAAFKRGLSELIDLDWLRMFDPRELQILISGAPNLIDITDWRRYTVYGSGYTDDCEPIELFWRVVSQLTEEHKRKLLKFATSCSNPPLLGFRDLYPQFTIAPSEETRLPTASTCMNLLKLPKITDEATMKSKILYAIDSNSGFDLS